MLRFALGKPLVALGVPLAALLAPRLATAQVNTDYGVSAGVMKRFTTGSEANDPGFGATAQLQGHVAVFPMVRAGLYAAWDISPMPSYGVRNFYEGGLHVKLTPPLLSAPWKTYLYAGLGVGYVRQEGYTMDAIQYGSTDGAIVEIPVGLGLAYRPRGHWELFFELGGRFGVGFIGRTYDPQNTATQASASGSSGLPAASGNFTGQDSFALSLSVGVSWSD